MAKCPKCNDTGVIETGNNDLPCDCPVGATALFDIAGVEGPVSGAENLRNFPGGALLRDPFKPLGIVVGWNPKK